MITFRPMPPLVSSLRRHRSSSHRVLAALIVAAALLASRDVSAQSTLSHTDDAAPLPAGMLRLRVVSAWTRFDARFAAGGGTTPLGSELSSDALGVAQLPRLAPVEAGLRTLTADPATRLSFGRLVVGSNARIVTTPIALDYGVTRRFTVGIVVPIVQTRRVIQAQVNPGGTANVGFVPASSRTPAADANLAVVTAYQNAAAGLGALIVTCQQNPGRAGCAPVNANPSDAAEVRALASRYASGVAALGTTPTAVRVAPQANSDLAQVINAQRLALNVRLQQYLGAGAGSPTSVYLTPFAFTYQDLQGTRESPGLLQSDVAGGLDSLHTTDRLGIGDVGLGAQLLVFDRFQHDTTRPTALQTRMLVGATVRFATSRPDSARSLADIPTGEGAGVEVRGAFDLVVGRAGGTVAARFVRSFARTAEASLVGDPESVFPFPVFGLRARRAGDLVGLDLTPRYFINEIFALDAHYGLERIGATAYDAVTVAVTDPCTECVGLASIPTTLADARTAQRVGFGFRYSTVDAFARGRARYPIELSFAHLETIRGDVGQPKGSRDQIQVRLFYRLRR